MATAIEQFCSDPAADVRVLYDQKDFRERAFTPMPSIYFATDLDRFSLMNPVTVDPAACRVHQSPVYYVRGIDGLLPGCKAENWRSLAPIIPHILKQLHVDEWVPTSH